MRKKRIRETKSTGGNKTISEDKTRNKDNKSIDVRTTGQTPKAQSSQ